MTGIYPSSQQHAKSMCAFEAAVADDPLAAMKLKTLRVIAGWRIADLSRNKMPISFVDRDFEVRQVAALTQEEYEAARISGECIFKGICPHYEVVLPLTEAQLVEGAEVPLLRKSGLPELAD